MKHIVSFSTGLSSALTVGRVLERYGCDNTYIVFMDTLAEDEDNYRFLRDCQSRWGKEITVLCDGRTPRQVAEDKNIIPNQKIAPCTFELKINLFRQWIKDTFSGGDIITIHIGYDIFEAHRCEPTRRNYEVHGWQVDFPLLWKPIEHRPYSQVVRDDWGIEPPRTYAMGFSHANCLGDTFCFKMGVADAIRVLINFPDQFAKAERWEEKMRDHPTRRNYAILRDQSGDKTTPLPLRELRKRYEAELDKQPLLFNLEQQSPACLYCGVGDLGCAPEEGGR